MSTGVRRDLCSEGAEWSWDRHRPEHDATQRHRSRDLPTRCGLPHVHHAHTLTPSKHSLDQCSQGHTKVCFTNHLDVSQSHQVGNLDVPSQEFRYLFSCLLASSQINGWTFCSVLMSTIPLILCLEEYYGCYYGKINIYIYPLKRVYYDFKNIVNHVNIKN